MTAVYECDICGEKFDNRKELFEYNENDSALSSDNMILNGIRRILYETGHFAKSNTITHVCLDCVGNISTSILLGFLVRLKGRNK